MPLQSEHGSRIKSGMTEGRLRRLLQGAQQAVMFARERSTRGQMKSPSIAQRGEGGVRDALPDSRHARSGPQRDDLLANTARRVPEGTRKGLGEESARFGPNPKGRGFAGDPCRYKTRQGGQPCLGFCASRLIPQKPRRARRESGSASLRGGSGESSPAARCKPGCGTWPALNKRSSVRPSHRR